MEAGTSVASQPHQLPADQTPPPATHDSPDPAWLEDMAALWHRIAPDHQADPEPWLQRLWHEHGRDVPLLALTRFAESGRTLADLNHPGRYQAYFRTCCTRLAEEAARPAGAHARAPAPRRLSPSPPSSPPSGPAARAEYRQDLRSLYLADRHPP